MMKIFPLVGRWVTTPFRYAVYRYYKFKYRKSFGPWTQWSLDAETRRALLTHGWGSSPFGVSLRCVWRSGRGSLEGADNEC